MEPVAKVVDVSSFDTTDASNAGVEFELLHPVTTEKTGVFITVLGLDSDTAREIRDAQVLKAQKRMQAAGRMVFDSPQSAKDQAIDLAVACTKAWRNMVYKGAPLEFSTANARMLYSNVEAIRRQVDSQIADPANFMQS